MTTLQIDTSDKNALNEFIAIAKNKFQFKVKILADTESLSNKPQTKWVDFDNKMDSLFTPDIIKHISSSRKEARDDFITNL